MKQHYLRFNFVVFFLFFITAGYASITPSKLRCENLENPLGIDAVAPRLSWQSSSVERGQLQTAYHILVASSRELAEKGVGDLWDSKKITSAQCLNIVYAGKPLVSGKEYFWRIRLWDNKDNISEWSKMNFWTTALLNPEDWKAKWIGLDKAVGNDNPDAENRPLSARMLRKEFRTTKQPKRATAYIAGLGLYELYINGAKIGDQVLAPAASDYDKRVYYNTLDITKSLKKGKNAIGVILGNGRYFAMRKDNPFAMKNFGFPKMIMQIELEYTDGSKQTIYSDSTWKITTNGPITANNEFDGETYDATKEMTGWDNIGFNDSDWILANTVKSPAAALNAQMQPNIKIMKKLTPISINKLPNGAYIIDMGQNMVGWCNISVQEPRGTAIKLRFAELLQKDGNLYTVNLRLALNTDLYITKGVGTEQWQPRFTYHGFRYVEISGLSKAPLLSDITGCVVYDEMEDIGKFETSNQLLNQIHKNAYWGMIGNYRSFPTDCPQRDERMAWLGDRAVNSLGESFLVNNHALYAKWAQDIADSQTEEGSIPDVAPAYWSMYSDNITWPACYFLIHKMMYEQYGDQEVIAKHYKSMKKWVAYIEKKYLINDVILKDVYGDWCIPPESPELVLSKDPNRKSAGEVLSTAYFYYILNTMQEFATILQMPEDKVIFQNQADKIRVAFQQNYFNPITKIVTNNTVTTGALALSFDLIPSAYQQDVFNNILATTLNKYKGHVSTGLIGAQWLNRTFSKYNRPDIAYKIATNTDYPSFGYMISQGATTIWELWNGNTAEPSMNSGNHVMLLGDLIVWFYENLAGIKADAAQPAFKNILMKPTLIDGLTEVNCSYNSPYGLIKSHWKSTENKLSYTISIPCNSKALVHIPTNNANTVTESGATISSSKHLRFIGFKDNAAIYEVASGDYVFESDFTVIKHVDIKYLEEPTFSNGDTSIAKTDKIKTTINNPNLNSNIYYTLDSTEPTAKSLLYKQAITCTQTTLIKAKAIQEGAVSSTSSNVMIDIYDPLKNGFKYSYYEGKWEQLPDYDKLTPIKIGKATNLNLTEIANVKDYFGIKYIGYLEIKEASEYTFVLTSDDGSKLLIDDVLVVINDGIHGTMALKGKVKLSKGKHKIQLDYFEGNYGENVSIQLIDKNYNTIPLPMSMIYLEK